MLMISLLKHSNQHPIDNVTNITITLAAITVCLFRHVSYGSQSNFYVLSQGSRAQLKQTLTSIMVIQTKLKHQHLKSIWLVTCEAGDAVNGVV